MKKKRWSLVRTAMMLLLCLMVLAGCSSSPANTPDAAAAPKATDAPTAAATEAPTDVPKISLKDDDSFTLQDIPEELMPTDKKIVVWMWGDNEEYQKYYDGFLADYPEYELDFKVAATSDHVQLTEAVISGVGVPDAVLVAPRPADAYYTGLYQPLDFYLDNDPNYKREDINPMALAGNTFAGKTYFVCEDLELCALGWNKTLFAEAGLDPEKPPRTFSEFEAACKALTKYNSSGEATQIGYKGTIGYWALSSAMGRYVTGSDGFTVEFDTKEIRDSLEFSKSVPTFYNNKLAYADDEEYWNPTSGHAGLFYVNCKHISDYITEDLDIGIAPWPVADDYTGEQNICVYSSQQYGIPAAAKNPNGGWLFIRWMVTKGIGEVYNEEQFAANPNGYIPQYQSNANLREAVNEKFMPMVSNPRIIDLWEQRDAMYDKATMFLWSDVIESKFHPSIWASESKIYDGLVTITDQCAKIQKLGEKLHKEWIEQKLADGWTWTDDQTALVPPAD